MRRAAAERRPRSRQFLRERAARQAVSVYQHLHLGWLTDGQYRCMSGETGAWPAGGRGIGRLIQPRADKRWNSGSNVNVRDKLLNDTSA